MMILALLLLATAPPAYGDSGTCETCARRSAPGPLEEVARSLPDVPSVPCPGADALGLEAARREYQTAFASGTPQITGDVKGTRLSGTPEQLKFANALLGDYPPKDWPTLATQCQDVLCALKAVYGGEETALRALTIAKRSGYTISLDQWLNPANRESHWSASEVRKIDEVLSLLPATFSKLPSFQKFYRLGPGVTLIDSNQAIASRSHTLQDQGIADATPPYFNGTRTVPGYIRMTDASFDDQDYAYVVIAHELAHQLDYSAELQSETPSTDGGLPNDGVPARISTGFEALSGWKEVKKQWWENRADHVRVRHTDLSYTKSRDDNFVTDYSKTSPFEDWADSIGYSGFMPAQIKRNAPDKYDFVVKHLFGGQPIDRFAWPEFDQAVDASGGIGKLLTACLKTYYCICTQDSKSTFVWEPKDGSFTGWSASAMPNETVCLQSLSETYASIAQNLPDACAKTSQRSIEKRLLDKIQVALAKTLTSAADLVGAFNAGQLTDCGKDVATRPSCYDRLYWTPSVSNDPALKGLSPQDLETVHQQVLRLVAKPADSLNDCQ